jgi:hypothetical protein
MLDSRCVALTSVFDLEVKICNVSSIRVTYHPWNCVYLILSTNSSVSEALCLAASLINLIKRKP